MKLLITIITAIFISSCNDVPTYHQQDKGSSYKNADILYAKEIISKGEKIKSEGPSGYFLAFTDTLIKIGCTPDTNRLKKVCCYNDLKQATIQLFKGKPFYKVQLRTNLLYSDKEIRGHPKWKLIKYNRFERVKSIWSYFYRKGSNDGVIEQWEFENVTDAKAVLENLKEVYPLPYYNTQPYYTIVDNYLFIFQTRAMSLSYEQKANYERFKKMVEKS